MRRRLGELRIDMNGFHKRYGLDEIPDKPTKADHWMIDSNHALWWTPLDKMWRILRFMPFSSGQSFMRSEEYFPSKDEAWEFISQSVPTWTKRSLLEEKKNE